MKYTAKEITADGLAAAAAILAVNSHYLQEHNDLEESFWYFFDLLTEAQEREADRERLVTTGRTRLKQQEALITQLPGKVAWALKRGYLSGYLTKLVSEASDQELLSMMGIGRKGLAQIRAVFNLGREV